MLYYNILFGYLIFREVKMNLTRVIAVLCGLVAPWSLAQQHVHDHGSLLMIQENDRLQVQFDIPAANIFNFEHQAITSVQNNTVREFMMMLNSPQLFIQFNENCRLSGMTENVSQVFLKTKTEQHHHAHVEEHHEHANVIFSYEFSCKQAVRTVRLPIFERAITLQQIEVQWIDNQRQGLLTVSRNTPSFSLLK